MEEADREFVIASRHNLHIRYYVWRERAERERERERGRERKRMRE